MKEAVSLGFPPIAASDARVLVLGSLPSKQSIADQQYYAHRQNKFWPIMDALVGAKTSLPYSGRVRILKKSGIAVWDVLSSSVRPGSMDSAIIAETSVPNDIQTFLWQHRKIVAICFNGQAAAKIFDRQIRSNLDPGHRTMSYYTLPSSSPAYASMSLEEKQKRWAVLLKHL